MASTWLCLGVAWIVLQGAAQPLSAPTLGPTGDELTADDLAQIRRLANEAGGELWLVVAHAPEFGRSKDWHAAAYLHSDARLHGVRWGRWVGVHAVLEDFNAFARPKTWRMWHESGTYVQVPLLGTDPGHVAHSRDLNRPFPIVAVRGLDASLSSESVAQIVDLVRANPTIDSPPLQHHPMAQVSPERVEGAWPIGRIAVTDASAVQVTLLHPSETRGQLVHLRHDGVSWRVEGIGLIIQ